MEKIMHVKLPNGKYLITSEIAKASVVAKDVPKQTHHLWIRDRSGSMEGDLRQLMCDMYDRIKQLPVGDIVSLGWFSGRNQFGWDIAGFKITDQETDFQFLKSQLDKNNHTIGLTCYSDILRDAKNAVISKYNTLLDNFSVIFFTDGYPNVDSESEIFKAVNELEPLINTALVVGYGNYYNKELLAKMAEHFGGVLTHSQKLSDFSITLHEFLEANLEVEKKTSVSIPIASELVFSVNNKQINTYKLDEKNAFNFAPSKRNKDYVYYISASPIGDEVELDGDKISNRKSSIEPVVKGLYAYTYIQSSRTKTDDALTVLAKQLGDVALIEQLNNAFTPEEYGKVEDNIKKAVGGASKRHLKGYNPNFLPKDDAFCIVDLVELLQTSDDVYFYPSHPLFEYSRIGVKSESAEGQPKFTWVDNPKCELNKLVWNDKKLNLSVQAKIHGTVEFVTEDYITAGFAKTYPTFVFRNYTLVKDGYANIDNLVVSLPNSLAVKLSQVEGLLSSVENSGLYTLNLKAIPVMNRQMGKDYNSATELFTLAWKELNHEAFHKVYNNHLQALKETVTVPSLLTEAQQEFLTNNGIGFNGFSPAVVKSEPTDYYTAKEFKINISKYSSLPPLKDVNEKKTAIKDWKGSGKEPKFTPAEALINKYMDQLEADLKTITGDVKGLQTLALIEQRVKTNSFELSKVRTRIQKAKFAIILGKNWFKEFNSRDESSLTLNLDGNDVTFNVVVKEVQVDI